MSKMFWSADFNGWFNEEVHGARLISVVDQSLLDMRMVSATAMDQAEYESECRIATEENRTADGPELFCSHAQLLLEDPPMMMVSNPACLIPGDAVEIDAETYALLHAEHGETGNPIKSNATGEPFIGVMHYSPKQAMTLVRMLRDRELRETDNKVMLPDYPITPKERDALIVRRAWLRAMPAAAEKTFIKAKKEITRFDIDSLFASGAS